MHPIVRGLAILGWSILGLSTSFVSFAAMAGFLEGVQDLPRDRVARDLAFNLWTGVAFGIAGIIFLLGCLGRLPGTRHAGRQRLQDRDNTRAPVHVMRGGKGE